MITKLCCFCCRPQSTRHLPHLFTVRTIAINSIENVESKCACTLVTGTHKCFNIFTPTSHCVGTLPPKYTTPTGPLNCSSKFSYILEPLSGYVYHFYIIHSLSPLTMLELFFGHCGTLPRLRGPSWTFMDPQMDPKMDPPRLISGDPS